ncbi:MAG: universal stress protein [Persicimonas sp.]
MSVLVAVDFSKHSHNALRLAAHLARERQVPLVAVHCVASADEDAFWRHLVQTPWEVPDQIRRVAKARLVKTVDETLDADQRPDQVEYLVELDSAADGIIAAAERSDADIVIVGAIGGGRIKKAMLGGTAERVIRTSPVPILAVAPDAPTEGFETILAPVDLSESSRRSLETAVEMAREENARLLIMHSFVLPTASLALLDLQPPAETVNTLESQKWSQLDEFVDAVDLEGVDHDELMRIGPAADAIESVVDEKGVDLICMGTHGRSGFQRVVLGSVATRVLRRMPSSVLAVPMRKSASTEE